MSRPGSGQPKRITILGSTGSIGQSTIDLIERNPDAYRVEALTAGRNVELLAEQARRLKPRLAVIRHEDGFESLKSALAGTGIEAASGEEAVLEAASREVDWAMAAIVGAAGLRPTLQVIRNAGIVAVANKECLVCAGELLKGEASKHGTVILPADSEHNAIFQIIEGSDRVKVADITLTASGGPFRTSSLEDMERASCDAALAHPTWKMGKKISIDSATMMNKGLELIEAHHLFDMPEDRIGILVHPQSIVHALVTFIDGSVLAHLGTPDMRIPISYTLGWPQRLETPSERQSLGQIGNLSFEPPDPARFPALRLAREALRQGGQAPIVLNAANEEAVASFLSGEIGFLDIPRIVEETLHRTEDAAPRTIGEIMAVDTESRSRARCIIAAQHSNPA